MDETGDPSGTGGARDRGLHSQIFFFGLRNWVKDVTALVAIQRQSRRLNRAGQCNTIGQPAAPLWPDPMAVGVPGESYGFVLFFCSSFFLSTWRRCPCLDRLLVHHWRSATHWLSLGVSLTRPEEGGRSLRDAVTADITFLFSILTCWCENVSLAVGQASPPCFLCIALTLASLGCLVLCKR